MSATPTTWQKGVGIIVPVGLLIAMPIWVAGCGNSDSPSREPQRTTSESPSFEPQADSEQVNSSTSDDDSLAPLFSQSPIDQVDEGKLYREALQSLDQGDERRAEQIQRKLESHPVYGILSRTLLAFLAARSGNLDAALQEAEQISTVPAMREESYMLAGEVFRLQGRWGDAIGCFRKVVELNPGHARAHQWLGALYHDTGAMQRATHHLRTVARIDQGDYRSLRLAGLIHYEYQNFREAARDYEWALQRDPPERVAIELRLEYADSLRELRQFEEALDVLASCPALAPVLAVQAECYESAGQIDEAKAAAEAALEVNPDELRALVTLGRVQLAQRQIDAAIPLLQHAVHLDPPDHEARFLLGRALIQNGQREAGEVQLERATELKELFLQIAKLHLEAVDRPEDVEVRLRLGSLAEELGRPRIALTWYEAARGLEPGNQSARAAVERLRKTTNGR